MRTQCTIHLCGCVSFLVVAGNSVCKQKLVNNRSIPSTHAENKKPFILINTCLLHIPLLALTDGRTELQTEKQIHSLRVGQRNLFTSCAVVSVFLFLQEIGFGVTYVLRVQYSCGVVLVFWFWREIVFCVTYVLSVQYSCAVSCVSFLVVVGNSSQNKNTF